MTRNQYRKHAKGKGNYLLPDLAVRDFDDSSRVVFDNPSLKFKRENAYVAYDNINLSHVKKLYCRYNSDNGGILEVRLDELNRQVWANLVMKSTFGEYAGTSASVKKPVSGLHKLYYILKPNEKSVGDGRIWELQLKKGEQSKNKVLDSLRAELEKAINPIGTPVMRELRGKGRQDDPGFQPRKLARQGRYGEMCCASNPESIPKGSTEKPPWHGRMAGF